MISLDHYRCRIGSLAGRECQRMVGHDGDCRYPKATTWQNADTLERGLALRILREARVNALDANERHIKDHGHGCGGDIDAERILLAIQYLEAAK